MFATTTTSLVDVSRMSDARLISMANQNGPYKIAAMAELKRRRTAWRNPKASAIDIVKSR